MDQAHGIRAPGLGDRAVCAPLLEIEGVCKRFPGVVALSDVSMSVARGEVHAVVGENGAGKSTLMMILSGVQHADSGRIAVNGETVSIKDPAHAHSLGIGTVFQELSLVPALSVAENILPNQLPSRFGLIRRRESEGQVNALLQQLGIELDPWTNVAGLSVAARQLVEIAKALSNAGKLLILDEPTSSLTPVETDHLFQLISRFKQSGGTVIYVSHKLSEVFQISDRITVLRDGCKVGTVEADATSPDEIVSMMVGRALDHSENVDCAEFQDVLLRVRGASHKGSFHDVSFDLRAGQILGFAGVRGAGRTELARGIFGLDPIDSGGMEIEGKRLRPRSPHQAMAMGIAYVPEDRKDEGLFLSMSVWENLIAATLPRFAKHGAMDNAAARASTDGYVSTLRIKTSSIDSAVESLSGGNQQKVLLAKWLLTGAKVLIVDEPTRGVDVSARAEIHDLLNKLAARGTGIILISSDLPELLALSDSIYVMRGGTIVGHVDRTQATEETVVAYATGVGI